MPKRRAERRRLRDSKKIPHGSKASGVIVYDGHYLIDSADKSYCFCFYCGGKWRSKSKAKKSPCEMEVRNPRKPKSDKGSRPNRKMRGLGEHDIIESSYPQKGKYWCERCSNWFRTLQEARDMKCEKGWLIGKV